MSSLQTSTLLINPSFCCSNRAKYSSSSSSKRISYITKLSTRALVDQGVDNKLAGRAPFEEKGAIKIVLPDDDSNCKGAMIIDELLYAVLDAVADRIEMHDNIGEQRDNWNSLLLSSINMITLTASTMAGVAATATDGAPLLALKLSSALLFSAATGMLIVMNKIQPSQLAEEQRNATRLFKKLRSEIQTTIALGNPTEEDVKDALDKVLALDNAFPLPLLGKMLDKFPSKFEPARWWPHYSEKKNHKLHEHDKNNTNGWNMALEAEMREVIEVVRRKDMEEYERLGNLVLKINKALAISGPLLTGIAAVGCTSLGSWGGVVAVVAGALASVVNALEHGGQVGMVFEMYRNCGGFFQLLVEENENLERTQNGELFEMKMALQLGRSVSQLRELASNSASSRLHHREFASKLF